MYKIIKNNKLTKYVMVNVMINWWMMHKYEINWNFKLRHNSLCENDCGFHLVDVQIVKYNNEIENTGTTTSFNWNKSHKWKL